MREGSLRRREGVARSIEMLQCNGGIHLIKAALVVLVLLAAQRVMAQSSVPVTEDMLDEKSSGIVLQPHEDIVVNPHSGVLSLRQTDLVVTASAAVKLPVVRAYDYQSADPSDRRSNIPSSVRPWHLHVGPALIIQADDIRRDLDLQDTLCGASGNYRSRYSIRHADGTSESVPIFAGTEVRAASGWRLDCKGGVRHLTSPEGLVYTLTVQSQRLGIGQRIFHTTEVSDGGSWVRVDYFSLAAQAILSSYPRKIYSSDGGEVELMYESVPPYGYEARLSAIRLAPEIEVKYEYSSGFNLNRVLLPSGRFWRFRYMESQDPLNNKTSHVIDRVESPFGGISEIESGFPVGAPPYSSYITNPEWRNERPPLSYANSIVAVRRVSSIKKGNFEWRYEYDYGRSLGELDVTRVHGPDGVAEYKHVGIGYFTHPQYASIEPMTNVATVAPPSGAFPSSTGVWKIGTLVRRSLGDRVEDFEWVPRKIGNYRSEVLGRIYIYDDVASTSQLSKTTVVQNGVTYLTVVKEFDEYGNILELEEIGPGGVRKTSRRTFEKIEGRNIIKALKSEVVSLVQ